MKDKLLNAVLVLLILAGLGYGVNMIVTANPNREAARLALEKQKPQTIDLQAVHKIVAAYLKPERPTLVLFLSTQCHFCKDSSPAYRQVLESPAVRGGSLQVVTVFPQPRADVNAYLATYHLNTPSISDTSSVS